MATSLVLLPLFLKSSLAQDPKASTSFPSSCVGQQDGYHWLKPMDGEEYPLIHQLCSREYMVIDLNEDPNIESYFSSYTTWHYALSGPEAEDGSNWEEWWLPNDQYIKSNDAMDSSKEYFSYTVSPDCNSCDIDNNWDGNALSFFNNDRYDDRTAYYMTGTIFGCLTTHKALKDCSWDYDSYECVMCTLEESDEDLGYHIVHTDDQDVVKYQQEFQQSHEWSALQVGLCGVFPRATYDSHAIPQSRQECFSGSAYKPSIGNDGSHCVCVKPTPSATAQYKVTVDDFAAAKYEHDLYLSERDMVKDTGSIVNVIELWQKDFEDGTYRIQKSGTYKIMENIVFDFNAGDLEDPSAGTSWWPTSDQIDQYPGAGTTRDEYFLGFFAGITVEVDDVVIDLNGFELSQSLPFYHQQRFFSCIALKSVAFPLNQGPGVFGSSPVFASNVTIKNGKIGLSSHHGIHGHYNKDVVIEDVHVYDFETHGIQMSFFENLKMKNVEIGPSSKVAFMKGEYAFARWTLQRLDRILESDYNKDAFPIRFADREHAVSLEELIEKLQNLVDIAFKAVMGVEEYDDRDPEYIEAKELFINEDGIPYGAVMYGLFLNLYYANVFRVHPTLHHADNAQIENVKIHGLHHKMVEYVRMDDYNRSPFMNMWTGSLDAKAVLGDQIESGIDIDWTKVRYVGSALTDAFIALSLATDDWGEKSLLWLNDNFKSWAQGQHSWDYTADDSRPWLGCNNDRMSHAPKGVLGIRMDGVDKVMFHDLEIYDLEEQSDLGSDLCGSYWDEDSRFFNGGGHFLTNTPYFYGYTGNRVHGIFTDWADFSFSGEISIHDLTSHTGFVRGVGMYTESTLTLSDDVKIAIKDLEAGSTLYEHQTEKFDHPYAPAVSKPFHILAEWEENDYLFTSKIEGRPWDVQFACIYGRDGAMDEDWNVKIDNTGCQSEAAIRALSLHSHRSWVTVVAMLIIMGRFCRRNKEIMESTESLPLLNGN